MGRQGVARGSYRGSNDWLVDATTPGRGIGSGEGGRGERKEVTIGGGGWGRSTREGGKSWLVYVV